MERRYGDRSVELNHESDLVYKKQNCFPHSEDPPKVKGPWTWLWPEGKTQTREKLEMSDTVLSRKKTNRIKISDRSNN